MPTTVTAYHRFHDRLFTSLRHLDGLPPLLMRLFLAPVFWMAGTRKFANFDSTVAWFGDSLGMPMPELMAFLAAGTETLGAILLLAGLAVRWISLPLMVTMVVAALSVHWDNGWPAIASSADPEVANRLNAAKDILREYGRYDWLTAKGNFVILNNGIEFAATYFIMLLSLLFTGAGRYFSIDYWLDRATRQTPPLM